MKLIWKFSGYTKIKEFKFGYSLTGQKIKGYRPDIIEVTEEELMPLSFFKKDYELYLRRNLLSALNTNGRLIIKKEKRKMTNEEVKKIAEDHWSYVSEVIKAHDKQSGINEMEKRIRAEFTKLCEFHYITAFVHGWKHGMEERGRDKIIESSSNHITSNDPPDPLSYFRGDLNDPFPSEQSESS